MSWRQWPRSQSLDWQCGHHMAKILNVPRQKHLATTVDEIPKVMNRPYFAKRKTSLWLGTRRVWDAYAIQRSLREGFSPLDPRGSLLPSPLTSAQEVQDRGNRRCGAQILVQMCWGSQDVPFLHAPMSGGVSEQGVMGCLSHSTILPIRMRSAPPSCYGDPRNGQHVKEKWKGRERSKGESPAEDTLASLPDSSFLNLHFSPPPFSTSISK